MSPRDFLAVIGAMSLVTLAFTGIIRGLTWLADDRRARRTREPIARAYVVITPVDPILASWLRTSQRKPWSPAALFLVAFVTSLAGSLIYEAVANADCGEERAAVKLGLDADARQVPLAATPATIAELVLRPAPRHPPEGHRVTDERGTERTVYTVHATITGYKLEADGDYHVVVADQHGTTMIVELPDPGCAREGAWGDRVAAAREVFIEMLAARGLPKPAAKLHRTSIAVTVSGVGFFDKIHGQTGVARNGIELHPVLAIEAGGGS